MSRRTWFGVALFVILLGSVVAVGAIAPPKSGEPAAVRVWKHASVRFVIEILSIGLALSGDEAARISPGAGAPFQESAVHPYFKRVRNDSRTRHFYYGSAPLDVADFAAMADFLRSSVEHGIPEGWHYQLPVLEMLDAGEQGRKVACGAITRMLIQLGQAGRARGRVVQLGGHTVAEFWSREYKKWVAMDADYDVWFSDAWGVPLSAYEIHQRVREGRRDDLVPHVGKAESALFRQHPEALYRAYGVGLAVVYYAQWLSQPLPSWHPGRNPATAARAYYPDATLEQRIYYRHHVDDPLTLYAPPVAFR